MYCPWSLSPEPPPVRPHELILAPSGHIRAGQIAVERMDMLAGRRPGPGRLLRQFAEAP